MAALAVGAAAGTAAVAAYINAKYHIRHDLTAGGLAHTATEAMKFVAEKEAQGKLLVYHMLQDHAEATPDRPFLEYEDRKWTYGEFFQCLQRVGNWLINGLDIQVDEMVALDGPNSPEWLMLWFALEGVGAKTAFINCNLSGDSLTHCLKLCGARYVLAERGIRDLVEPQTETLQREGIAVAWYDTQFVDELRDKTPLSPERVKYKKGADTHKVSVTPCSMHLLIYTSGTTGLPKAVMQSVGRSLNIPRGVAQYLKLTPEDKFYTCLPLYHGAAQALATTPVIFAGGSMRLGRKFSHKTFWPEVYESKANRLQYVGELCRYLVNAPGHPLERKHCLNEAFGNGMRPDVWERFRQRFNVPVIHELYAATDGMGTTYNRNQGPFSRNAIGVRGLIWHYRNGSNELRARIDPDTEDIIRHDDGSVALAGVNEPGEVIHRVDPAVAATAFRGYYRNQEASDKRWMHDVFKKDDLWFRSGDVMRVDEDGRVYFVDRLGDTFRWRSENVSTNEVADVVGTFHQIDETNVYGVAVPHADGRCGCAMLVLKPDVTAETLDRKGLAEHVMSRLPRYAVPLFLRVAKQISYTGTMKMQKGPAKREGVDLNKIKESGSEDEVFWLPPKATEYQPFGQAEAEKLNSGEIKL